MAKNGLKLVKNACFYPKIALNWPKMVKNYQSYGKNYQSYGKTTKVIGFLCKNDPFPALYMHFRGKKGAKVPYFKAK